MHRQSPFLALPIALLLFLIGSWTMAAGATPTVIRAALGTAFTYQGQLQLNGTPVNTTCTFTFKLFDAATGGNQIGNTLTPAVAVANGLFTTQLDFGRQFTGDQRWLDTAVNCGSGVQALSPRQELTATPYALGLLPGAKIANAVSNAQLALDIQGVRGESSATTGFGVVGYDSATTGFTRGVYGQSDSPDGNGVGGYSHSGKGMAGGSFDGYGVAGNSRNVGVYAHNDSVNGNDAYLASNCCSGDFHGPVFVHGDLTVTGNVSKASGSFKIDDPLDPANKYLYHSFVESPDMMDVYNGNITTDAKGNANIALPAYFETLNRDFRYQLTVIGQFAQAIVADQVKNNHFTIKTDKPNVKVSWQVTGIRQDAYANAHRIPVEEEKPVAERGTYLRPELYSTLAKENRP